MNTEEEINARKLATLKMLSKMHELNVEILETFGHRESYSFLYDIVVSALTSMIAPKMLEDGFDKEDEFFEHLKVVVMHTVNKQIKLYKEEGHDTWQH